MNTTANETSKDARVDALRDALATLLDEINHHNPADDAMASLEHPLGIAADRAVAVLNETASAESASGTHFAYGCEECGIVRHDRTQCERCSSTKFILFNIDE